MLPLCLYPNIILYRFSVDDSLNLLIRQQSFSPKVYIVNPQTTIKKKDTPIAKGIFYHNKFNCNS